jgi:hypothetical protein
MTSSESFEATGSMPIPMVVDPRLSPEAIALAHSATLEDHAEPKASPTVKKNRGYYQAQITLRWNQAHKAIMAVCHLIVDARINLPREEWKAFVEEDCPFDYSVLQKFMNMASHPGLNDPANEKHLPNSWTALYEIMQMKEATFRIGIQKGIIHPGCTLADLKKLRGQLEAPKRKNASSKAKGNCTDSTVATTAEAPKATTIPATPEEPELTVQKAAVKAPVNNRGLRVAANTAAAEPASTSDTGTATPPPLATATAPAKGRIALVVSQGILDLHKADLDGLMASIEVLVEDYDFIGGVGLEVAA